MEVKKEVTIVGAGLVGSLLSIYLSDRGYKVDVYERRPDMRKGNAQAGRSINLALSDRGIRALEEVGIMDKIRDIAIPMHGRYIHNREGEPAFQPYGKQGQYINSVSRGELNRRLMDLAEEREVSFFFDRKCSSVDWKANTIALEKPDGSIEVKEFALLFGADGAFSAVRLQHQLQHDRFQYKQSYIDFGYKELTIPAAPGGGFQLEKNALHIWPRGNYMLIALPNNDGSFTGTLFFPFDGEPSFGSLDSVDKVNHFFNEVFGDVYPLMPDLGKEFFQNPTNSLVSIECYPWIRDERFALIGDAAHAIVPFFGQGMNCGFEDCIVLNELIEKYEQDWDTILSRYQELRKPDGDAIAEMALNNFIEMRDKVADPKFLLQKKIEARLHEKYPDTWIPTYAQITFSPHIRYSEAYKKSMRQEVIMQQFMVLRDIEQKWNDEDLHQAIIKKLTG